MIERKFVAQRIKEHQIEEHISKNLKKVGHSHTKVQRTPLGEKVIIFASRPGLVVGRKGQNIKKLTKELKDKFNLENPQIEISEVEAPDLDAQIVAERIANSLERFGPAKFKGIGHKTMSDVMNAGALGVEIIISGKIPSARAKRWRFYKGYLKKCGDIALVGVKKAYANAQLKTGTIGVQVKIMPPDIKLPDKVNILKEEVIEKGEKEDAPSEEPKEEEKKEEKKEKPKDKGDDGKKKIKKKKTVKKNGTSKEKRTKDVE